MGENQTMSMSGFSGSEGSKGVYTAVFRGKKHVRKNMPCQDACSTGITGDGWIVMAVSDGVSSSPYSEKAAAAAVKAVVSFWREFKTCFQGADEICPVLRSSMNYALMETDKIAEAGPEPYGFETTLLIVLVNRLKQEMYYAYVGDGGIYVLSKDERVYRLTDVMRDEEESVYTLSAGPEQWKTGSRGLSDISSILIVTDGISDVISSSGEEFSAASLFVYREDDFRDSFRDHCEKVLATPLFLNMDDDATIALCTLGEKSPAPWNDEEPSESDSYKISGEGKCTVLHEPETKDAGRGRKRNLLQSIFNFLKE